MARIRTIKPEFPQSESMGRVSRDARLLFVMLWPICDDHGRTRAASRMLASLLFPYDDDAPGLIDGWLDELEREGCIQRYVVDGSTYLHIPKWLNHQKIDKPSKPQYPGFDDASRGFASIREHSALEGKGREGKGEEKNSLSSKIADAIPDQPDRLAEKREARESEVTRDAVRAYNASLAKPAGLLPAVRESVGFDKRRAQVRRVIKLASEICQDQYGDPKITAQFWADYFAICVADPFLSGRQSGGKGHENWLPDFEYLTNPKTLLKAYDRSQEAA